MSIARRSRKKPPGRDDGLRAFVRQQPCVIRDRVSRTTGIRHSCQWRFDRHFIEACHVRTWGSSRVDADNLTSLCPAAHDMQEGRTAAFESEWGVDLTAEAQAVTWRYRGDF